MEDLSILVIVAIGWAISAILKKGKQPKAKKPSQSGTSQPTIARPTVARPTVARPAVARPAVARPAVAQTAPAEQPVQTQEGPVQTVPVQQIFPGMSLQPAAPTAAPVAIPAARVKKSARKAQKSIQEPPQQKPLPHPESPANTQGGEGHEGPGEHPCLEHEDLASIARPRQRITPQQMRQAVVMTEILQKPVSLRGRCSQR